MFVLNISNTDERKWMRVIEIDNNVILRYSHCLACEFRKNLGNSLKESFKIILSVVSLDRYANYLFPVPIEDRNFNSVFIKEPLLKQMTIDMFWQKESTHLHKPFRRVGGECRYSIGMKTCRERVKDTVVMLCTDRGLWRAMTDGVW